MMRHSLKALSLAVVFGACMLLGIVQHHAEAQTTQAANRDFLALAFDPQQPTKSAEGHFRWSNTRGAAFSSMLPDSVGLRLIYSRYQKVWVFTVTDTATVTDLIRTVDLTILDLSKAVAPIETTLTVMEGGTLFSNLIDSVGVQFATDVSTIKPYDQAVAGWITSTWQ